MKRYGTRFTTGCGHSWKRRYPKWCVRDLRGATTDCNVCGELLIIPADQFADSESTRFPFDVHMPLFHPYMNHQDARWPANGAGTGYAEFGEEYV